MSPLAKMPDRATSADLQLAADLAKKAADDLDELVKATPSGCVCRRIDNDNYSYLDYHEECIHHRQYYFLREQLKADYAKMEKALKNEVRIKFVAAALAGTAAGIEPKEDQLGRNAFVENALEIAEAAIRRITETA
jgi:hypothetical protein